MNIKYTFIRKVLWTAKIIFCYFLIAGKLYDVKTRSFYDDLFRSGSSLLGNLLSLHPSTSFYYEPFKKFNIFKDCHHRFNNSEVSNFIEEILGGIFKTYHAGIFWKIASSYFYELFLKGTTEVLPKPLKSHLKKIKFTS